MNTVKNDAYSDLVQKVKLLSGEIDPSKFTIFHHASKYHSGLSVLLTDDIIEELANLEWQYYTDEKIISIASEWFSIIQRDVSERHDDSRLKVILQNSNFATVAALSYAFLMDFEPQRRKNLKERLYFWLKQPYSTNDKHQQEASDFSYVEYTLVALGVSPERAKNYQYYASTIATMDPVNGRAIKYLSPLYEEYLKNPPNIESALDISNIF